jgi:hypothetical protein
LQVYYVPTLENEVNGPAEDAGNVMIEETGKRIRIADNGLLTGDLLDYAVSLLWDAASEDDATIDEAYAGTAEDAGISVPRYLACKKMHVKAGEIFLSWFKTPLSELSKVVVYDEGMRQGCSAGDAAYFTGEVYDMPKGEVYKCLACRETFLVPDVTVVAPIEVAHVEALNMDKARTDFLRDEIEAHNLNECIDVAKAEDCEITVVTGDFPYRLTRYGNEVAALLSLSQVRKFLDMQPYGYVAPEIVSPEFDALSALKDMIRTMRPLADKAEALWRASLSGSAVEEINYQVWQDLKNATYGCRNKA